MSLRAAALPFEPQSERRQNNMFASYTKCRTAYTVAATLIEFGSAGEGDAARISITMIRDRTHLGGVSVQRARPSSAPSPA